MRPGFEYYTSTLSFDQAHVPLVTVRLFFVGDRPLWVRVYHSEPAGHAELLKDLRPRVVGRRFTEYVDSATNVAGQSARIYVFRRDAPSNVRTQRAA